MATIKKYNGSTWENTTARKYETKSEIITPPTTIYSDGTAITAYTLKGNTVQSGTPTPSNPVEVNGVGVRTENLFDGQLQQGYYAYATGDYTLGDNYVCTHLIPCTENTTYTFRCINASGGSKNYGYVFFDSAQNRIGSDCINELTEGDVVTYTATTPQNTAFLAINVAYGRRVIYVHPSDITDFMLNTGSTALPYEPYGYKIPISSGGVTTNIYLGSTQTVRVIRKLVLTGSNDENWSLQSINSYNIANFSLPLAAAYRNYQSDVFIFATHYEQQTTSIVDTKTIGLTIGGNYPEHILYIRENSTNYANTTAFKQYLADQYAAGAPVIIWYVLASPETAAVNEPLMKIGDYADTLSNATAIPTTEGANSITVDTTVQPSEFTATWTGWHDSSVKEWDGSDWQ